MPAYARNGFNPPAPIAVVDIRHPDTKIVVSGVRMLMDYGAEVSLLPASVVRQLSLVERKSNFLLEGFDGSTTAVNEVDAELHFCKKWVNGAFFLIEQEFGYLGRNILNDFALVLDGPNLSWDVFKP